MEKLESKTTKKKGAQVFAEKKSHFTGWLTDLCRRAGMPVNLYLFYAIKTCKAAVVNSH
jgi:hypothetical protein